MNNTSDSFNANGVASIGHGGKLHNFNFNDTKIVVGKGSSIMGRAGATITGGMVYANSSVSNNLGFTQSNRSLRSMNPNSFKAALDQIEEEILMLAAEVNYCKNEVGI
jgi:hypothetical protein